VTEERGVDTGGVDAGEDIGNARRVDGAHHKEEEEEAVDTFAAAAADAACRHSDTALVVVARFVVVRAEKIRACGLEILPQSIPRAVVWKGFFGSRRRGWFRRIHSRPTYCRAKSPVPSCVWQQSCSRF